MANNETVADIIAEVRTINKCADRIESAHKRELAAKDEQNIKCREELAATRERVTKNETIIAAHKREVAELRECLKEAIREKCPFTRMSCRYGEPCDYECGTEKWRKALEGVNDETK